MSIAPLGNSGHFQTSITSTEINSSSAPQETAQTKQALFSLYLEEKLQNELGELKNQYGAFSSIASKLANFWSDMLDTFEERTGLDAVEHDHSRDLSYLKSKGSRLQGEIDKMPPGPAREAATATLQNFLAREESRIEKRYQQELKGLEPGIISAPFLGPRPENVRQMTSLLEDTLQGVSRSPIWVALTSRPTLRSDPRLNGGDVIGR